MMIKSNEINNSSTIQRVDELIQNDIYKDSIFRNLKRLSSKRKGKYFEELVEEILTDYGYTVTPPYSTDHDRVVNGLKMEIKGSFLWGDEGGFRWQQIRVNQDYDFVCFLAIYPEKIELFSADKETIKTNLEITDNNGYWIYNQHGGKKINSGTFFIQGLPENFLV